MESTTDLPAGERARDVSARLWSARGFFWGLASIGLAFMGQQALVTEGNTGAAWVCYILAILLLLASLSHPSLAVMRRIRVQGPSYWRCRSHLCSFPEPPPSSLQLFVPVLAGWSPLPSSHYRLC